MDESRTLQQMVREALIDQYAKQNNVTVSDDDIAQRGGIARLREACGENMGCNFDPSHLFWQQADPVAVIKALRSAIYHVHAKDTAFDAQNLARNGVLDNTEPAANRAWTFRSVGYGHDALDWKQMISALRVTGYDHAISIEHEDSYASVDEGLSKAIAFLQDIILREQPAQAWWV